MAVCPKEWLQYGKFHIFNRERSADGRWRYPLKAKSSQRSSAWRG